LRKKVIEVTWQDIECAAGWHEEDHKPLPILKSVGLLVRKGDPLTIASTYDKENKRWADVNKFPKGCVLGIREIEVIEV